MCSGASVLKGFALGSGRGSWLLLLVFHLHVSRMRVVDREFWSLHNGVSALCNVTLVDQEDVPCEVAISSHDC